MSYAFTLDRPADGVAVGCAFNGYQMNQVRLILIEAGAIAGDGFESALKRPGLEPSDETLAARKFRSNAGWHITAAEADFIATRLRAALHLDVIADLLMFLDETPDPTELRDWVEEFATFNEMAGQHDGYYVS